MADIIFKTLVTFCVIYSLIDIAARVISVFFNSDLHKNDVFVVVRVKNQEDKIECIIRSLIWKTLSRRGGGKLPIILIVDVGSDDRTREICMRLCEDYRFIYYTTESKYNEIKNKLL